MLFPNLLFANGYDDEAFFEQVDFLRPFLDALVRLDGGRLIRRALIPGTPSEAAGKLMSNTFTT